MPPLTTRAQAVQDALARKGLTCQVRELPASTRSAREAATAIGCEVAQIAKSIVFRAEQTARPVLVIASGVNRIRESAIAAQLDEPLVQATPAFVRRATGFAIGGVPPCGHPQPIITFIDRDLLALETLWAAAGTPHAVFALTPHDLLALTEGTVVAVG